MKAFALFLLLLPCTVLARGLSFTEEMHGYAYWQGEFKYMDVYLNVVINDVDQWRWNANYPASVTGTLVLDHVNAGSISGSMLILAPAPGDDGRLLVYKLATNTGYAYAGVKHVRDDHGFDLVDDTTTLHGALRYSWQPAPSIYDLLYTDIWPSELHFEWWKPDVVWNFGWSFHTFNCWWWEDLEVKAIFVRTVLGGLAEEFFPWLY